MGLFSKKVTSVASVAVKVISDTPNVGNDSILLSILTERDITADHINAFTNGIGLKMRNMQIYAAAHYHYGLPNGVLTNGRTWAHLAQEHIETELGSPVEIISAIHSGVLVEQLAFQHMQENHDWEASDGIVDNPPVGFTTGDVTYVNSDHYGPDNIRIEYSDDGGSFFEDVSITPLTPRSDYFHVEYYERNAAGQRISGVRYWNYRIGLGTYPDLEFGSGNVEPDNPYFPIVPFRVNNVNYGDSGPAGYATSASNLLDRIGMDFNVVNDEIHNNPGIADIDHAFLYCAAPLDSDRQNTTNYLHDHFKGWEAFQTVHKRNYTAFSNNYSVDEDGYRTPPAINTVTITDSSLKLDYNFLYCHTEVKSGTIGTLNESIRTRIIRPRITHTKSYTSGKNDTVKTR